MERWERKFCWSKLEDRQAMKKNWLEEAFALQYSEADDDGES